MYRVKQQEILTGTTFRNTDESIFLSQTFHQLFNSDPTLTNCTSTTTNSLPPIPHKLLNNQCTSSHALKMLPKLLQINNPIPSIVRSLKTGSYFYSCTQLSNSLLIPHTYSHPSYLTTLSSIHTCIPLTLSNLQSKHVERN